MIPMLPIFRTPEMNGVLLGRTFSMERFFSANSLPGLVFSIRSIVGIGNLVIQAGPGSGSNAVVFKDDNGGTVVEFSRNAGYSLYTSIKFSPGNTHDIGGLDTNSSPRNIDAQTRVSSPLLYGRVIDNTAGIAYTVIIEHGSNDNNGAIGDGVGIRFRQKSSTTAAQEQATVASEWVEATHATRKAKLVLSAYDTAIRTGLSVEADGTRATSYVPCGGSTSKARIGGTIFDHFADAGNVGTGEDDLYSDSVAASTLSVNGDKLEAYYSGELVAHATDTRQIRVYFGGTVIYDSTALASVAATDWHVEVKIIRDSSSSVRCSTRLVNDTGIAYRTAQYATVGGLTLTNAQILKITGESAGAAVANNDVVAHHGSVKFHPAA